MKTVSALSVASFSAGVALSTATQLRIPGTSYGPGELLLLAGAFGMVLTILTGTPLERSPLLVAFGGFWVAAFAALTAGAVMLLPDRAFSDFELSSFFHDTRAFAFVAIVLVMFLVPSGVESRFRRITVLVFAFSIAPLAVLWVIAQRAPSFGPFHFWYWSRFLGWTQNPNQLALVVVTAPFIALHLSTYQTSWVARVVAVLTAIAAIVLGLASQSDALVLCWLAAGGVFVVGSWGRLAIRGRHSGIQGALAFGVAPAIALLIALWAGPAIERRIVSASERTASEGNQGSTRVELWGKGLRAFATAPVFGLGPGAHAGDVRGEHAEEAHNTLIDWASSAGAVGVAAYLALLGWLGVVVWRTNSLLLVGAFVALFCFSMFHFVLRHPIYWQQLVSVAAFALHRAPVPAPRRAVRRLRPAALRVSADRASSPAR